MRDMTQYSDGQKIVRKIRDRLRAELGREPTEPELMKATRCPASMLRSLLDETPHGVPLDDPGVPA